MQTRSTQHSGTKRGGVREIGRYGGENAGPSLICIGGIHGNEPAGVQALEQVIAELHETKPHIRGQIIGFAGNLTALEHNTRFIGRDLNRQWLAERVEHLRSQGAGEDASVEDREQWELLTALDSILRERTNHAIFLDLHTTSGPGAPFAIIEDTMPNRRLAFSLPIPVVLGLEEQVEGTFIDFVNGIGHRGISVEGGQNEAPSSVAHLRAVVWTIMASAGMIKPKEVATWKEHHDRLVNIGRPFPRVLEACYRHGIHDDDVFEMKPGFSSFNAIRRGDVMARDRDGDIHARMNGYVLLPLYQKQGNDGFFVVKQVKAFWLWLAALLRGLGAGRWLHVLPGLEQHHGRPNRLVVDKHIVRYYPKELFTLLGYRRQRRVGSKIVLLRRPQRLRHPEDI